jgi:SAM-dependent methyltransferase
VAVERIKMKNRNTLIKKWLRLALKLTNFTSGVSNHRPEGFSHSDVRDSVTLMHNGMVVPPAKMRDMVRKNAIHAEDFILEGSDVFCSIKTLLGNNGLDLGKIERIYEFGVGCARIARHLVISHDVDFLGSDVDGDLIQWCAENICECPAVKSKVGFCINPYEPPLKMPPNSFDLIYSISVFTHLAAETQIRWFRELERLLRPEGHLLISIIEKSTDELPDGVATMSRFDDDRFARKWLGLGGAPSVYLTTSNTVDYVAKAFPLSTQMISCASREIRNKQSLILFKKCSESVNQY